MAPTHRVRPRQVLSAELAVREVWLCGSRAMGRHRPGSDIDLILVAPGLRQHVARVGRRLVPAMAVNLH